MDAAQLSNLTLILKLSMDNPRKPLTNDMMIKRLPSFFFALVIGLAISSTSDADFVYTFEFDQATYQALPGETIDVGVYLREEVTSGETPRLASGGSDGGDGLFTFKFQLDFSSVSGGSPGAVVNSVNDVTVDNEFSRDDRSLAAGTLQLAGSENFGVDSDGEFGVNGVALSLTEYRIKLAEIAFTAGAAGSETTLLLSSYPDDFLATTFADFTVIDSVANFGSSTIVTSAVPEPSALWVLAGSGAMCLLRRRKFSDLGRNKA